MAGSIWATNYIVNMPQIGVIEKLLSVPAVTAKTAMSPDFSNPELLIPLLIVPLAVQWWSVWYSGVEPGGGGYIAQRMLPQKMKDMQLRPLYSSILHTTRYDLCLG